MYEPSSSSWSGNALWNRDRISFESSFGISLLGMLVSTRRTTWAFKGTAKWGWNCPFHNNRMDNSIERLKRKHPTKNIPTHDMSSCDKWSVKAMLCGQCYIMCWVAACFPLSRPALHVHLKHTFLTYSLMYLRRMALLERDNWMKRRKSNLHGKSARYLYTCTILKIHFLIFQKTQH